MVQNTMVGVPLDVRPRDKRERGGKHRRVIYIPAELSLRLDAVRDRINVSAAACNGILAMVSVAEQDPSFSMPGRVEARCNRGHSLLSRANIVEERGQKWCRACLAEGRRFKAA